MGWTEGGDRWGGQREGIDEVDRGRLSGKQRQGDRRTAWEAVQVLREGSGVTATQVGLGLHARGCASVERREWRDGHAGRSGSACTRLCVQWVCRVIFEPAMKLILGLETTRIRHRHNTKTPPRQHASRHREFYFFKSITQNLSSLSPLNETLLLNPRTKTRRCRFALMSTDFLPWRVLLIIFDQQKRQEPQE